MKMALEGMKAPVDYINPHATSTPVGDIPEINAIKEVLGPSTPAYQRHQIADRSQPGCGRRA